MVTLMPEKYGKERLYWIIDQYLAGDIEAAHFCDMYYEAYDVGNIENISDAERKYFSELSQVAGRFSEFTEDHLLDSRAFSTEFELKTKTAEVASALKGLVTRNPHQP